jgi:hypothetical protein
MVMRYAVGCVVVVAFGKIVGKSVVMGILGEIEAAVRGGGVADRGAVTCNSGEIVVRVGGGVVDRGALEDLGGVVGRGVGEVPDDVVDSGVVDCVGCVVDGGLFGSNMATFVGGVGEGVDEGLSEDDSGDIVSGDKARGE